VGDALGIWRRPGRHRRDHPGRAQPFRPEVQALKSTRSFAYGGLSRTFHERGRLAVCTCLVAHPGGLSFTALADACGLTDGNLNRHLHALAELNIVALSRTRAGSRPATVVRITKSGRTRFLAYVDELEAVIRAVHLGERGEAPSPVGRLVAQA
jgi:DNA-binding MarR family transcriptional regulator